MSRSTRAAVKRSSVANARVQDLAAAPTDQPLHARRADVQQLVREARAESQAEATPAWLYGPREVGAA